ncbi:hypothetical protein PoB_007135100 [Plakobranchus ocellatus]|uniref:RNase H type-1 domain-containing protein n=1 Tax=Plakobranchus ocellatus TaxID=259542 RepID=A0AAV4DLK0_9GAST|nr:hypothetical protein PoB_007135100 [Plakobranchus ocellatus]
MACELKAVSKCLRVVIRRQWEAAALSGVVILTDCRAWVQTLGGSGREGVEEADYLQKTERVKIVVQWLPSHVGVIRKEIAGGLANQGRTLPQSQKPSILADVRLVLRRGIAISEVRRRRLMTNDSPNYMKLTMQMIICKVCAGATHCKFFERGTIGAGWASKSQSDILWRQYRVAMTTAANMVRKFLRRAIQ